MKGMAAEDTLDSHKHPPAYPVFQYRFISINRTRWFISATGGEKGRNKTPVKTYD
jgi:hypothetical protein